ncbi:hypothetical protein ACFQ3S_12645 [Mucilaginibacter terrae]|uniref:hypothetical protein n=1 Tax=Mucilaginibacter terrae TaxID=1955052 RepID=UPI0036360BC1
MNTKIFNSLVLAVCGILFCLITADINGKWSGSIDYNGSTVPLNYNFKSEGDKFIGTSETPLGTNEIMEGKIEKDVITFKVDLNGELATHTGKIYADSINLKINYQGNEFMTTLKRSKAQ